MKRRSEPKRQPKRPAHVVPEETPSPQASISFPIVGIGASAGGLEALEQFFRHVPPASGMAFVIVQHLDPTHKGIMPNCSSTPLA
jgi:chemotaxis response regulator CheB